MSLDLSHSNFDEMLKKSAMDFMRKEAPKLVVEELLADSSRIWVPRILDEKKGPGSGPDPNASITTPAEVMELKLPPYCS